MAAGHTGNYTCFSNKPLTKLFIGGTPHWRAMSLRYRIHNKEHEPGRRVSHSGAPPSDLGYGGKDEIASYRRFS